MMVLSSAPLSPLTALSQAAESGVPFSEDIQRSLHAEKNLLAQADATAVRGELLALLQGKNVLPVLLEYGDVLAVIIPEIGATLGFDQKNRWHAYTVWEHTARAVAAGCNKDPLVRLTLLFHDLAKPVCFSVDSGGSGHFYGHSRLGALIAERRMKALNFDKDSIAAVMELIFLHLESLKPEKAENWLMRLGTTQLQRLIAVKRADTFAHGDAEVDKRLERLDCFARALDELTHRGTKNTASIVIPGLTRDPELQQKHPGLPIKSAMTDRGDEYDRDFPVERLDSPDNLAF